MHVKKNATYQEVKNCRVCGAENLKEIFSLGEQYLTGVFPAGKDKNAAGKEVSKGPVDLILCESCRLLQLRQSYSLSEMYGENYGYRSGLNASMVRHLEEKIKWLEDFINLKESDMVIDIGSNDATSLKAYRTKCTRVGIDPSSDKFRNFYPQEIDRIADFFSKKLVEDRYPHRKAKIITSIAMFYDLEDPIAFAKDVEAVLAEDGIWHFEQSYMPLMLERTAYDTICHEHLEFYSFSVIQRILNAAGLKTIDVVLNDVNGGSFAVTAAKRDAAHEVNEENIGRVLTHERNLRLDTEKPYRDFVLRIEQQRKILRDTLIQIKEKGKKIFGYGASTKGNVLLQYCDITSDLLSCIVEVNEEKFGAFTPGTNIPIISESEGERLLPDYYLVLPWHFKDNILPRVQPILERGAKFIFPLPELEIIGKDGVSDEV